MKYSFKHSFIYFKSEDIYLQSMGTGTEVTNRVGHVITCTENILQRLRSTYQTIPQPQFPFFNDLLDRRNLLNVSQSKCPFL